MSLKVCSLSLIEWRAVRSHCTCFLKKTFKERKTNGEFTGRYEPQNKNGKTITNEQVGMDLFSYIKTKKYNNSNLIILS
jgi:hypothetical protein